MDKSTFYTQLADMCAYTLQDKSDIRAAKNKYPYSSVLQMMDLLSDKAVGTPQWESRFLPKTNLYMVGGTRLTEYLRSARLVESKAAQTVPVTPASKKNKQPDVAKTNGEEKFDIIEEINSYQEVSFKTAPKSVILSKFLETGNYTTDELGSITDVPIDVLGKKSIQQGKSLETETLALILERQGKYDKAIEVYEKLISRNPEKDSTFAVRISELKMKLENKKQG